VSVVRCATERWLRTLGWARPNCSLPWLLTRSQEVRWAGCPHHRSDVRQPTAAHLPQAGDQVWVGDTLATVTDVATFALTAESAREDTAYPRYLEVRVQLGVKDE